MGDRGSTRGSGGQKATTSAANAATLVGLAMLAVGCAPTNGQMTSFAPLVREVIPAVVNVSAVQIAGKAARLEEEPQTGLDLARTAQSGAIPPALVLVAARHRLPEDRGDDAGPGSPGLALGSGFVIDPSGYIVTDDHVLENAARVTVTFHDATQHPARIVGRDGLTDLALLKIDVSHPIPYVKWGNSDAAKVGDWVLAIGNPFGLGDTVSSGIISARGRDIHSGPYDDFLQIDASINRGNSGGPTFDLAGRVIGINSAIYSPNGGSVGIGFAIPANLARPVIAQLKARGKVERGWLGVEIQPVTAAIAESFGLPRAEGALIDQVSPSGPAGRAGFAQGDVILSVNGRAITRMRDLPSIVAEMPIGRSAEVTVWRHRQIATLTPVMGQMPDEIEFAGFPPPSPAPSLTPSTEIGAGLRLEPLSGPLRHRLRVPPEVSGAVVTGISDDNPLAGADLLPGDVIEMINEQKVASPADAYAELRTAASGGAKTILMLVDRHGSSRYLALSLTNPAAGDDSEYRD